MIEGADLVIWACGYQTKKIPIYDTDQHELKLSQMVPGTQFDVDLKCRVMLKDGHVLNKVLACGIGYPARTTDGITGSKSEHRSKLPRADGFALYSHEIGDKILKNLIPKHKIMK